jgi:hypothetical protein
MKLNELLCHVRNKAFELTGSGLWLPKARSTITGHGTYVHDVNGQDEQRDSNLLVDEGLVYLLTLLGAGSKLPNWYMALYGANYTPVAGLTAASFPATASEITSTTEGYSGGVRPAWTPTAPTTPLINNTANKAAYTIVTASSLTVYGAAMLSETTRGAVTGTLLSASKFTNARVLYDTDVFNLGYQIELAST